jgi:hypothetical protein
MRCSSVHFFSPQSKSFFFAPRIEEGHSQHKIYQEHKKKLEQIWQIELRIDILQLLIIEWLSLMNNIILNKNNLSLEHAEWISRIYEKVEKEWTHYYTIPK